MMAGQKKRNKKYRPRLAGDTIKLKMQPWKVAAVFGPLESILDQLEQHGTIDVAGDRPVFRDHNDGHWYDTPAALVGVIGAYEIHEVRTGRPLQLEPLRRLANKLQYGMPVFSSDTEDCRACLVRMKAETIEMTAGYARDLIKDFQIKEALEQVAA